MVWFKIDDKLHESRKARRAGLEAMGMWGLAGSYCGDNLTDGFVPEHVLTRWAPSPARARKLAGILTAAGLWHAADDESCDCPIPDHDEPGWRFHEYLERNPSRAEVEAERESARIRMRELRSRRSGERSPERSCERSPNVRNPVPSRPDPTRKTVVTSVSQSPPHTLDDDGLTKIRDVLRCPLGHARKTADLILAKANGDVTNPTRYVLAAIAADPHTYAYKRGNPRKGQECPTHAGEWADACRGCAADKLGG